MSTKNKLLLAVIALLAALALAAAFLSVSGLEQRRDDAVAALDNGEVPTEAAQVLSEWTAREPDDIEALSWLFYVRLKEGEVKKALDLATLLDVKDARHPAFIGHACGLYFKNEMWSKAARYCGIGVEEDPDDVVVLRRAARSLVKIDSCTRAIDLLERLNKLAPGNVQYLTYQGHCEIMLGRTKEARQTLEKALALAPRSIETLGTLARLYHETGQFREAARAFETILEADPKNEKTLNNLIVLHAKFLREPDKARTYIIRAREAGLLEERLESLENLIGMEESSVK